MTSNLWHVGEGAGAASRNWEGNRPADRTASRSPKSADTRSHRCRRGQGWPTVANLKARVVRVMAYPGPGIRTSSGAARPQHCDDQANPSREYSESMDRGLISDRAAQPRRLPR